MGPWELSIRRASIATSRSSSGRRGSRRSVPEPVVPNATRVLRRLGRLDAVAAQATRPSHLSFRTWSNGAEICRYRLGR